MNPGLYCKHSSKKREVKSSDIFYYQNNNTPKITNSINANLGLININKISDMETGLAQFMAMFALVQPQYGNISSSTASIGWSF